ncbi:MAG: hypothetical protein NUV53_04860 [Patescibacteria group bacterium]|nr:hypothetical protein [Patescibacteria group bacterium]
MPLFFKNIWILSGVVIVAITVIGAGIWQKIIPPLPSSPSVISSSSTEEIFIIDPIKLQQEIEELKAARDHIITPKPVPQDSLTTQGNVIPLQMGNSSGSTGVTPAPTQSQYVPPQSTTIPPASPAITVPSTPPAPPQKFTITGKRFCSYVSGLSSLLITGYPFTQDEEVDAENITSWTMTSIAFQLPSSFPAGTYSITVRGYQEYTSQGTKQYGYCNDEKAGFIKVN